MKKRKTEFASLDVALGRGQKTFYSAILMYPCHWPTAAKFEKWVKVPFSVNLLFQDIYNHNMNTISF